MKKANFKYPEHFKKVVRDSVWDYQKELGFRHWSIKLRWFTEGKQSDDTHGHSVAAECYSNHRYLEAEVSIYPRLHEEWLEFKKDDQEIRRVIAHEIAHLATHHMWHLLTSTYKDEGESRDAWESLTTIVGRLLFDNQKKK